jgi:hypothetical protein
MVTLPKGCNIKAPAEAAVMAAAGGGSGSGGGGSSISAVVFKHSSQAGSKVAASS